MPWASNSSTAAFAGKDESREKKEGRKRKREWREIVSSGLLLVEILLCWLAPSTAPSYCGGVSVICRLCISRVSAGSRATLEAGKK